MSEEISERIARLEERMNTTKENLYLARDAMEKRLESMNEFRQQLKDQTSSFITRPEHDSVLADIRILRESKAELQGKASQSSVNIALIISFLSGMMAVISLIIEWVKK
jgi:hypothetical protein